MRKQVKIKDVGFGDKFFLTDYEESPFTKVRVTSVGDYSFYESISGGCFAIINDRIIAMDNDCVVYIEVPNLNYKDIKVGEKFKIGQCIYLKVHNMMRDRLDITANPCVCLENNFLYNCNNNILVERL